MANAPLKKRYMVLAVLAGVLLGIPVSGWLAYRFLAMTDDDLALARTAQDQLELIPFADYLTNK